MTVLTLIQWSNKLQGNNINNLKIDIEILCIDDASKTFKQENENLIKSNKITYQDLQNNIGRSRIRNLLAQKAIHENLLFLDCDVQVPSDFLDRYLPWIGSGKVVYGGTFYTKRKSVSSEFVLHYRYGRKKEMVSVKKRELSPYTTFKTNNFLTPKKLALEVPFNEELNQYGHEDTLWAFDLKARQIPINHIQNPITHLGLEKNTVLIQKIEKSLQNLDFLNKQYGTIPLKLNRFYHRHKNLWKAISNPKTLAFLKKNLLSDNPSLKLLDLYKLLYLSSLN